ncbi:MAG: 2-hydroxyglutaryl-CoA dehydratase D-component [Clostridia bacterium 62_21]|nr:MAG: 2-hydroxyglutaryl-CoA dehydratase D-component [Clostridia bacterium 62_21]
MHLKEVLTTRVRQGLKTRALKSPWTYRLLRTATRRSQFPLEATRQMVLYALRETERAFAGNNPVVWTSAFFPTEIAHALGFVVFSPEVASALLASLGLAEECLDAAERTWYGRDLCSFHRCAIGATLMGYFPPPTALLASGHLCDGAPKAFEAISRVTGAPMFFLDVPRDNSPEANAYVAAQLEDIGRRMAAVAGKKWDPARVSDAVKASEAFRQAALAANRARTAVCDIRGGDMLNYVYLLFVGQGDPEAGRIYATLARELAEHRCKHQEDKRPRLLWLHLKPYFDPFLLDYLEVTRGAAIVVDEMNHIYWPPLDTAPPLDALARKVLAHYAYHTTSARAAVLARLARTHRVDGVIQFVHWGCRATSGTLNLLMRLLRREGLPFLALHGDCIDRRDYAPEQLRTRLDAFLELLGSQTEVV